MSSYLILQSSEYIIVSNRINNAHNFRAINWSHNIRQQRAHRLASAWKFKDSDHERRTALCDWRQTWGQYLPYKHSGIYIVQCIHTTYATKYKGSQGRFSHSPRLNHSVITTLQTSTYHVFAIRVLEAKRGRSNLKIYLLHSGPIFRLSESIQRVTDNS